MRSNKPYVPLDPALIEQARQIDLLTYLRDCEPSNGMLGETRWKVILK